MYHTVVAKSANSVSFDGFKVSNGGALKNRGTTTETAVDPCGRTTGVGTTAVSGNLTIEK